MWIFSYLLVLFPIGSTSFIIQLILKPLPRINFETNYDYKFQTAKPESKEWEMNYTKLFKLLNECFVAGTQVRLQFINEWRKFSVQKYQLSLSPETLL